jgi:hypothetical protein
VLDGGAKQLVVGEKRRSGTNASRSDGEIDPGFIAAPHHCEDQHLGQAALRANVRRASIVALHQCPAGYLEKSALFSAGLDYVVAYTALHRVELQKRRGIATAECEPARL